MEAGERAENLERQAEEAEALAAIYGDDFVREGDGGTGGAGGGMGGGGLCQRTPLRSARSAKQREAARSSALPLKWRGSRHSWR